MNDFTLSQTEPISSLPRNYADLLKRAKKKQEPVILLKRNKPVGGLLGWELLKKLIALKRKVEERKALKTILKSEKEFEAGKGKILKSLADLQ